MEHHLVTIDVQCCTNCPNHAWLCQHQEQPYLAAYCRLLDAVKDKSLYYRIVKNRVPFYLEAAEQNGDMKTYKNRVTGESVIFPLVGSFEITINNILLFSKISDQRFPTANNLQNLLSYFQQHIRLDSELRLFDKYKIKLFEAGENKSFSYPTRSVFTDMLKMKVRSVQKQITPYVYYAEQERRQVISKIYNIKKLATKSRTKDKLVKKNNNHSIMMKYKEIIHRKKTDKTLRQMKSDKQCMDESMNTSKRREDSDNTYRLREESMNTSRITSKMTSKNGSELSHRSPDYSTLPILKEPTRPILAQIQQNKTLNSNIFSLQIKPTKEVKKIDKTIRVSVNLKGLSPRNICRQTFPKIEKLSKSAYVNQQMSIRDGHSTINNPTQTNDLKSTNTLSISESETINIPKKTDKRGSTIGRSLRCKVQQDQRNSNLYNFAIQAINRSKSGKKTNPIINQSVEHLKTKESDMSYPINTCKEEHEETSPVEIANNSLAQKMDKEEKTLQVQQHEDEQTKQHVEEKYVKHIQEKQKEKQPCQQQTKQERHEPTVEPLQQSPHKEQSKAQEAEQLQDISENNQQEQIKEIETRQEAQQSKQQRQQAQEVEQNQVKSPAELQRERFPQPQKDTQQTNNTPQHSTLCQHKTTQNTHSAVDMKQQPIVQTNQTPTENDEATKTAINPIASEPLKRAKIMFKFNQLDDFDTISYEKCLSYSWTDCFVPSGPSFSKSILKSLSPNNYPLFNNQEPSLPKPSHKHHKTLYQAIQLIIDIDFKIIQDLFEQPRNQIYSMWLHNGQFFESITVDDKFLFSNDQPIYAPLLNGAIWLMVLEKCMAKMLGDYRQLEQLSTPKLIKMLTGCPMVVSQLDNSQRMQSILEATNSYQPGRHGYLVGREVSTVIGFDKNKQNIENSLVYFKQKEKSLQEAKREYCEVFLIKLNHNYFNQKTIQPSKEACCVELSTNKAGQAFISLINCQKIELYRKIDDKRYSRIGTLHGHLHTFMELKLMAGQYLMMMGADDNARYISIASQNAVVMHRAVEMKETAQGYENDMISYVAQKVKKENSQKDSQSSRRSRNPKMGKIFEAEPYHDD